MSHKPAASSPAAKAEPAPPAAPAPLAAHLYGDGIDTWDGMNLLGHLFTGPFYDPPYETPLQDTFAWLAVKHLAPEVALEKQIEVKTLFGAFRLDFVARLGDRRIAVTCLEQLDEAHALPWVDAVLLGTGAVDAVYHLSGTALIENMDDALLALSKWEPAFFSERGMINLRTLSSEDARSRMRIGQGFARVVYRAAEEEAEAGELRVSRATRDHPADWKDRYEFARRTGGPLAAVMEEYARQNTALTG